MWFLAAAVALVRPKWGVALIWPAIWLYPNTALYGTLPLNVRFDDLWIVFIFVLAVFYARGKSAAGGLLWLAVAWSLCMIVGNLAGLFVTGGIEWQQVIKSSLKTLYVPMITYILAVFLNDERDVLNHMKAIVLAAVAAGALGIAMVYFPRPFAAFLIPGVKVVGFQVITAQEMATAGELISRRAQGAVGTFGLAAIMMTVSLMALSMTIYHPGRRLRLFFALMMPLCLVALAYTVMRGAIGGLLAAILWAILFTRRRGVLLAVSVVGILFLLVEGGLLERVLLRVTGEAGARETPLIASLLYRFKIWETFVENFSPVYLLTGMGMSSVLRVAKATAHNTYLGAFVYGGLLGVALLVATIARAWGLGRRLRACLDPLSEGLGVFMFMVLVSFMVYGITNELFQQIGTMQLFFAAMVFAQKRLEQVREAAASPAADSLPLEGPPEYAVAP